MVVVADLQSFQHKAAEAVVELGLVGQSSFKPAHTP